MPLDSQFSLSLELSKVIPFGSALNAASRGMLHLVREFQNSGSDIVTEYDLAEVFGRNFVAPLFASTFRTAVKTSISHRLSNIAELVLEAGAGPTVKRALNDTLYFPTIVQLSLLLWPHEVDSLAKALAKALEHRAPKPARNIPRIDLLRRTLECIRQQTSGFMWEGLFAAEEQRLGDILELKQPYDARPIPYIVLQPLLDALTAVQRLPDQYYLQVRTPQGTVTLVIWAHHVLGLTIEVRSSRGTIKIGKEEVKMSIDCRADCPSPEVILFNEAKDITFRAVTELGEKDPVLEPVCRHPLHGYGSRLIGLEIHDISIARIIVLHTVNSALRIAEECKARQEKDEFEVRADSQTPSKEQIVEISSILFPQFDVSLSELDTLAQETCMLRSDWKVATFPTAFMDYFSANRGSKKSIESLMKHLCHIILAFTVVDNPQTCQRSPFSLYNLPRERFQIVNCLTAREAFETIAIMLLGKVPDERKLDAAAVISSWGWSICVNSLAANISDPSQVRAELSIIQGVPSKFGERREWILSCDTYLDFNIVNKNSKEYIEPHRLVGRPGDQTTLRSFINSSTVTSYIGTTETAFEVFQKYHISTDEGGRLELHMGFRWMQDIYWNAYLLQSCDHDVDTSTDLAFTVPADSKVFYGFQMPYPSEQEVAQVSTQGSSVQYPSMIYIPLTAGNSTARWALLDSMRGWKAGKNHTFLKAIYLRCDGCCMDCAVARVKKNMVGEHDEVGLIP